MKDNKRCLKVLQTVLAGCLTTALAGCSLLPKEEEPLKPPLVKPVKENFELYEVKRANIAKQVTGIGTFASDKMDYLYFNESGGRLASIDVALGSNVGIGDVLAELDKGDIEGRIKQQQIVVEKAKIAVEQTKEEKRGDVQALRLKMLDVQKEQVQLDMLQKQLDKTKLASTIEGIVTYIDVIKPGDAVTAYKSIFTISDPKSLKLVYEFTNINDLTNIQIGMPAEVKIKGKPYQGTVVQIPSTTPISDNKAIADKNAKSVMLVVQDLPPEVEIGSSADISIVTEQRENVLVIPRVGLRSYLGRDYVQVMEGESRKEIDVEKGIVSTTEVEIRKGLKEGQKVILNN
ncbi:efflux RND transporter periplasmic adaptor subunit [Paenibacillus thalictri]|uniref:HlyD family efflux transporter periplasmic adaptor subunit n=1 Tax=Paenibacillus thalictri TaxID=2527873 RepID=A0A4Q9DWB2_9BACL|nr:efflux RND transporter periplasmic adaptor subunit [Paenibacillus thalictri]TBL80289.1 HlyD family efflux transporter periplasmic adaptor subunit [Paenibacillus thalictri]